MIVSVRTASVEDTHALARTIATFLRPNDLIVLSGELGGGKTAFVQGLANGLEVREPVTSPTFTLVQTYAGRMRLHHLDVYRLQKAHEVNDLNLPELLDDSAVVAIEWGERIISELPDSHLLIHFQHAAPGEPADVRHIRIEAKGRAWQPRVPALADAVNPLREEA
jgi:tRNA threonylcarbamoyladenosine biosynthesis protein TsaE